MAEIDKKALDKHIQDPDYSNNPQKEYEEEMDELLLEMFNKWNDTNEQVYDLNWKKKKAIKEFLGDVEERLNELVD